MATSIIIPLTRSPTDLKKSFGSKEHGLDIDGACIVNSIRNTVGTYVYRIFYYLGSLLLAIVTLQYLGCGEGSKFLVHWD
jgi:hypothetical protein